MRSQLVKIALLLLLSVSACGGDPYLPTSAPTTSYLVTVPADATPTVTPFQPVAGDPGLSGFPTIVTSTLPPPTAEPTLTHTP